MELTNLSRPEVRRLENALTEVKRDMSQFSTTALYSSSLVHMKEEYGRLSSETYRRIKETATVVTW